MVQRETGMRTSHSMVREVQVSLARVEEDFASVEKRRADYQFHVRTPIKTDNCIDPVAYEQPAGRNGRDRP